MNTTPESSRRIVEIVGNSSLGNAAPDLVHTDIKIASLQSEVLAGRGTKAIRSQIEALMAQRTKKIREMTSSVPSVL